SILSTVLIPLLLGSGSFVLAEATDVHSTTTCVVDGLYQRTQAPVGTLAATVYGGEPEEVSELYTPASLRPALYDVTVTRSGPNFYRITGKDLFVRTRYCYEYAYSQEAILDLSRNELIFR